jgi:hypothetical protein
VIHGMVLDSILGCLHSGLVGYGLHTGSMLGSVGPSVGMRTGNFFFEAGPALYFSSSSTNIGAHGSVGLSALY